MYCCFGSSFLFYLYKLSKPKQASLDTEMSYQQTQKQFQTFLNRMSYRVLPEDERKQLKIKRRQIKSMQSHFKQSIILLKTVQNQLQDKDIEDNMRITGFKLPRDKVSKIKIPPKLKININEAGKSERKRHIKSEQRILTIETERSSKQKNTNVHKLSLPSLIQRANKHKRPTNASNSRSNHITLSAESPKVQDEIITYEDIKSQRQKVQELRRMNILSKVVEENYKRQIKNIETRRKIFLKNKDKEVLP